MGAELINTYTAFYRIRPLVPALGLTNPVIHPSILHLRSNLIFTHLSLGLRFWYLDLSSLPCVQHILDVFFFYLIIRIMFDKEYKLWSFSLCSFLLPAVKSSVLGPNILLMFSNTVIRFLPECEEPSSSPTQKQLNCGKQPPNLKIGNYKH
jgi:hypothetical protein